MVLFRRVFGRKAVTDQADGCLSLVDKLHSHQLISLDAKNLVYKDFLSQKADPIQRLLKANLMSEQKFIDFMKEHFFIESVNLQDQPPDDRLIKLGSINDMRKHGMIPFKEHKNILYVAMDTPYFVEQLTQAERLFDGVWSIQPLFAIGMSVSEAIDHYVTRMDDVGLLIGKLSTHPENVESEGQDDIIKLVEAFLIEALYHQASDIHFDQRQFLVHHRLRIDGVLQEIRNMSLQLWGSIQIRLKVMANIDMTEDRLPQDGSFFCHLLGKNYDFRLSSLPSIYGESIVIRSTGDKNLLTLGELKLLTSTEHCLKRLIRQPSGLILIGGPTGSGKTTTLYALLQELPLESINVAALEDPVEHILHGVRQTSIRPDLGMSFASGIRAMLRQDPDVLLIGEVRDSESAELALKASLTGHLVLATVHVSYIGDIPDRMENLLGYGGSFYQQSLAFMSQRLLRKLCESCRGVGCVECHSTGYKGRFVLLEVLPLQGVNSRNDIQKCEYMSLIQMARQSVEDGLTDDSELERVFGETI